MKDPKEIAAGILSRGKAQSEREGGGVLCVGCHIGYMSPTCPTHGPMKEAHDKACADHTARAMAYESVTELCAKHGNLGEYIAQLERERDSLRLELDGLEVRRKKDNEHLIAERDQAVARAALAETERDALKAEIVSHQDGVRNWLLDRLEEIKIGGDIDGGGCDSGDWRDFTLSEISQGFSRVCDHYYDIKAADDGALAEVTKDRDSLRAQLATAIGIIAKLRGNHPDNFNGYGVGQRKDGDTTLSMWHEADAFLAAHQRDGGKA